MIFFTSICSNYLPKAITLAKSVKAHCRDARFVLCLVEREVPEEARACPYFDEILLAKDAGWDNFESFIFRHSIVEASTAVKAQAFLYLLNRYSDSDKFVFLDPDVMVYADFVELEDILDRASIVLAPHLLRPGNVEMEMSALAHGTYNLGFLAVSRSENSIAMLRWWAERLSMFCYDDKARGIFTDQRWIDLVPSFFDAHILKHHGYDFATWSLMGSDLRESNGSYIVNGDPLRFIHFSGVDSAVLERVIRDWLTDDNRECFQKLHAAYRQALKDNGQKALGKFPWSYNVYNDGTSIAREARLAYRRPEMWAAAPRPFALSNSGIMKLARVTPSASQGPSKLVKLGRSLRVNGVRSTLSLAFNKLCARGSHG